MKTIDVAGKFVSLCQLGEFEGAAMEQLFSAGFVRVEPVAGTIAEMRGSEIAENIRRFMSAHDVHGVEVAGPFVGDGQFAVRFAIHTTFKPTGERTTITKLCLYAVKDGKLAREEVFYAVPPHPVGPSAALGISQSKP
jgi:hypothetical protein